MESTTQENSDRAQGATQKQTYALHPIIARLFHKQGLTPEDVRELLSWDLNSITSLTNLQDLEKAAERLIWALENKQKIGIYGDYDVDGTTSCALLYHFFQMLNVEVELIQPSRFVEGYGLHPSSIDQALNKEIQLLVTVDCGITNNEAASYAKEKNLDLIITDHHKDGRDEMPDALAVVNPNRRDEETSSELTSIAGVTVAFCLCLKTRELLLAKGKECSSLYPLLQFVAVGTICDLVPLNKLNLKLVRHGLKQIPKTQYPGIKIFFPPEERERGFIPSEKLSFAVGPMINSKGRLDHPEKALELLTSHDIAHAHECYNHLDISNKERKTIQNQVYEEAREQVLAEIQSDDHPISIVYHPEWHEGVIGIVASKLVENFKAPAIVFTDAEEEGVLKASARTAGELSIFEALNDFSDRFLKFGGHKAAAGLSMNKENFEDFKKDFTETIRQVPAIERSVPEHYDLEIRPEEIDPKLVKDLELLEPYGNGNPKPIFKMTGIRLDSYDILKDVHVRWNFSSKENPKVKLRGISFFYVGKWNTPHPEEIFRSQNESGESLTAFFTLGINRFNGNEYIQLMVNRISVGEI